MKRVKPYVEAALVYINVPGTMHPEIYHYEWKFNDEARQELGDILKNEATDKEIKSFIHYLEGLCQLKKMLIDQSHRLDVREARERILKDCKAALKCLRQVYGVRVVTWYDERIDPLWSYRPDQIKVCSQCEHPFRTSVQQREKCIQCDPKFVPVPRKDEPHFIVQQHKAAGDVILPMVNFIKVMESYHNAENKKNGRPTADNDHFIEKIAEIYSEHIGKPTLYAEGPFYYMIKKVKELLGLKHDKGKAPRRGITRALKK